MYRVTIYDGPDDPVGELIHMDGAKIRKAPFKLHLKKEGIDDVLIKMNVNNPGWLKMHPKRTLIEIYNERTGNYIFKGRVLKPTRKMNETGIFTKTFACEGRLAYLHDSEQSWEKVQDTTIADFFKKLIENHNEQVEPYKRFKVGRVTVKNSTDNVYRYIGYGSTYDEIKEDLMDSLGGYLQLRDEPDGTYIDYLEGIGEVREEPIHLKNRLQSFESEIDPTEVITRIRVLGTTIDEEPEEGAEETQAVSTPRITMASVNNGLDYIVDEALENEFGIQYGTIIYDDVREPTTLLNRAKSYRDAQQSAKISYSITALNIDLIRTDVEALVLGNTYPIMANIEFNTVDYLQIVEMIIDSENLQKHQLTVGSTFKTLTQYQTLQAKRLTQVYTLKATVDRQSRQLNLVSSGQKQLSELYNAVSENAGKVPDIEKQLKQILESLENGGGSVVDENGYATNRVFPVDYTLEGVNFFVREGKAVGSIEYDMTYGMRDGVLHSGHDIGTNGDRNYTAHATTDGVVRKAEFMTGGIGNAVYVEHTGDKFWSNYMHLKSISVSVGQTVKAGDVIGVIGGTGGDYAPHLHFEISPDGNFHSGGNTVNPQAYLGITGDNTTTLPRPV
ncbi:peptidoglycan DD-metalloendopeptidase family protein [Aerococcus sp. L_32]|uniref:peptidoglycan DD-metalloendopeptidase family protein n=1 Tax=Aerococcus sp. L_32 TaxID=3422316 RepID=UPI003D6AC36F